VVVNRQFVEMAAGLSDLSTDRRLPTADCLLLAHISVCATRTLVVDFASQYPVVMAWIYESEAGEDLDRTSVFFSNLFHPKITHVYAI
jgi:hypothetical protein